MVKCSVYVYFYCTDLTPPKVTKMDPLEPTITIEWTPQPCAMRYRVSWTYTNDNGTTTTGSGVSDQVTNYTIPTSVQGVYTVSVQAVDGVGNVGPATSEVVRSSEYYLHTLCLNDSMMINSSLFSLPSTHC